MDKIKEKIDNLKDIKNKTNVDAELQGKMFCNFINMLPTQVLLDSKLLLDAELLDRVKNKKTKITATDI